MRQKPAVMKDIDTAFHLSKLEKTFLLTASVGEGLLLIADEHYEIKIISSSEEHKLITTNPDEILAQKEVKEVIQPTQKQQKVNIKVDTEKGFYKHRGLDLAEVKYLISKGYKESIQKSCFSNRKERYLLKPRFNETLSHYFLIMDIASYLKSKKIDVEICETKNPDIIFSVHDKTIAIEVETGKMLRYNKKELLEKAKFCNNHYAKWFFVVTDKNFRRRYSRFGEVVDTRYLKNYLENALKKSIG